MTFNDFKLLQESLFNEIKSIGATKGVEYAKAGNSNEADRLNNFKSEANELGINPEVVLWIFMNKHLKSIRHYVITGQVPSEGLRGKIIDAMNYLSLLYGLHVDRIADSNITEVNELKKELTEYEEKQLKELSKNRAGTGVGKAGFMTLKEAVEKKRSEF